MTVGQYSPVDMLMYYDARPCVFNGLFDFYTYEPLPGYWPFVMFSRLYELGTCVKAESDDVDLYAVAAIGKGARALILTHYRQDGTAENKTVDLCLSEPVSGSVNAKLLSRERTPQIIPITFTDGCAKLVLPENSVLLIELG